MKNFEQNSKVFDGCSVYATEIAIIKAAHDYWRSLGITGELFYLENGGYVGNPSKS